MWLGYQYDSVDDPHLKVSSDEVLLLLRGELVRVDTERYMLLSHVDQLPSWIWSPPHTSTWTLLTPGNVSFQPTVSIDIRSYNIYAVSF